MAARGLGSPIAARAAVLVLGGALAMGVSGVACAVDELVQARLVAESTAIKPGGTAWLAVELAMKPGWHTYWRNPGDAGQATSMRWTVPDGFEVGGAQWPVPASFTVEIVTSYGYKDRVALLVPVTAPANAKLGMTAPIEAEVSWLACEKICIPGEAKLDLKLRVAAEAAADPATAPLFAATRASLPRPAGMPAVARAGDGTITIDVPASLLPSGGEAELAFLPFDDALIDHGAPQRMERTGGGTTLELRRGPRQGPLAGSFPGLLLVRDKARSTQQAFDLTVFIAAR
jgi:thiol:disulfide interchange protein DsbD